MQGGKPTFKPKLSSVDTGARYKFTLPPYPPGEEPSVRPPDHELDPKLNGLTYTEAMRLKIQKPVVDKMTV